jgi:DNA repair protein RecN (Recombination protein N)
MERADQGAQQRMSRLRRCTIENVGLIARAEVPFSGGLTAFSGETGSGKTMLLGALQLALGERASPDLVGRDADGARVTLEVDPDDALRRRFAADGFGIDPDEDATFVREVQRGGKSSARINGRPATAAQLRAYGETLVDFVGQHEQQRLLSGTYQTDLLDRFAGDEALELRERVAASYAAAGALDMQLAALETNAGRALAEAEFARFAAAEIASAKLSAAEEAGLRERRSYLANAARIAEALEAARGAIGEREGSAVDAIGAAAGALGGIARLGESLAELHARTGALQDEARELAVALSRERDRADLDPEQAEEIGARLDAIERLKQKYGPSVEAVIEAGEQFAVAAAAYDAKDERAAELRAERDALAARFRSDAQRLSDLRASAARELERRVASELPALAMKHAQFAVAIEPIDEPGARGAERATFALAANRGETPRPLARAASGGELSRTLLALVVVLAGGDGATLVFDEIDAGIGGATANAVGVRLGALARATQVVCVTHLAQIASWADANVTLRKHEARGRTRIDAVPLARDEVRQEVARMLSGSATAVALEHADALLHDVQSQKKPVLRTA